MGSSLSTYACCLADRKYGAISLSEKTQYAPLLNSTTANDKMAASRILTILQTPATKSEVQSRLQQLQEESFSAKYNWEGVAACLFDGVKVVIEKGTDMSEVMRNTCEDVKADYDAWKMENPEFAMIVEISAEIALTVLALAILGALMPWALDALGLGALGPRLGSWAARWQSIYLGETPSGSLFSFLQSMEMKYPKAMIVIV